MEAQAEFWTTALALKASEAKALGGSKPSRFRMKFTAWLALQIGIILAAAIDGFFGWFLLDDRFHLGYLVWWGLAFFGAQVVMTGTASLYLRLKRK